MCAHTKSPATWGHQGPCITQFLHWGDGGGEHTAVSHRNAGLISASGHVSASAVCKERWALCFEPSLLQWLPCYPKQLGVAPSRHPRPRTSHLRAHLAMCLFPLPQAAPTCSVNQQMMCRGYLFFSDTDTQTLTHSQWAQSWPGVSIKYF